MTDAPRRSSVWGRLSLVLAVLAFLIFATVGFPYVTRTMLAASTAATVGLGVWALAQAQSDRRSWRAAMALRQQEIDAQAGRLAIAADLHDIVSHGLGMITLRAQAARLDPDPEAPKQALADIEAASRRATAELRHMLTALRSPDDAPLAPSPTLASLADLVDASVGSGLAITVNGADTPVSDGVGVTFYRVAQEALANAARHAGPTTVRVTAYRDHAAAHLEIADDGPAPGWEPRPGTGMGIAAMRRRVETMGGQLHAEPAGRGFRVMATIPDEATL